MMNIFEIKSTISEFYLFKVTPSDFHITTSQFPVSCPRSLASSHFLEKIGNAPSFLSPANDNTIVQVRTTT